MRARRARWVIFWVFAVPSVALVPLAYGAYPPVGLLLGAAAVLLLWIQVRFIRREERREAAHQPQRSDGELWDHWAAVRGEPGRMPEGHGPGDPEVALVLDEIPGDGFLPDDVSDRRG